MPNTYFRFKEFIVHQEKAAMKVTTDACMFGSLFTDLLNVKQSHKVLDIGAGTGLLTLMYAQQFPLASIDAVEIDNEAYEQATQNITESNWHNRITIFHSDVLDFGYQHKYDVIICNPPFYENDLKSPNPQRNKALHDHTLTLEKLIEKMIDLIADKGEILILLPYHRAEYCKTLAERSGLYCHREILVKQTERHPYFRSIMKFRLYQQPIETSELTIKINNEYSEDFKRLLAPFYLAL